MENVGQCDSGLVYNSFTLVFIQSFTLSEEAAINENDPNVSRIYHSIDHQIFHLEGDMEKRLIKRYKLPGFSVEIELENEDDPVLKGYVHVEASLFFDNTVSVTYRLVVDPKHQLDWTGKGFIDSDKAFTTDHLIALSGIPLGTEHWAMGEESDQTEIDTEIGRIAVSDVYLDQNGNWLKQPRSFEGQKSVFSELQQRYKKVFQKNETSHFKYKEYHFVFIDVWEDVSHQEGVDFGTMREGEIIEHIETAHRAELIGLFTLYPYEWPYRMSSHFETVCGSNIALDTDDLILANQNMCVVFGTYGLRGKDSPTDWQTHLNERAFYHVSWPEYLLIVEIILAKKQAVNSALSHFLHNSIRVSNLNDTRSLIEQNALMTLDISNTLLKLDAVRFSRYASHKIMYERTMERLGLEKDHAQLENSMNQIDQALNNVSNIREIRQANLLNLILGIISVASLFGILLTPAEIPLFSNFYHHPRLAINSGVGIMLITFLLIIVSALFGLYLLYKNHRQRRK